MTADAWNARIPLLVTQENDQTVNNSTTYVDSEITFTPEINAVYRYLLLISYSTGGDGSGSTGDFKWNWDAPNALFASFTQAVALAATGTFNSPQSVIFRRPGNTTDRVAGGANGSGTFWSAYDQGTFETDGTLNTITMRFAQDTAAVEDTILRGGNQTRMIYERII
ncbi:hypothetical protein U9R90_05090 [Streptomyces sp. E11-3]|uniref:hypothetical protein n=1 Tax=Streptomyces sp. E11-3 TaxID=3110112 RepID=UPI00397F9815